MKCPKCEYKKRLKSKPIKYDYSKKSGIPGCSVWGKDYTCPECKYNFVDLGDIDEINQSIAELLVNATKLTNKMCRFVRVHIFDESIFEFAKRIKINPRKYDNAEKNKVEMHIQISMAVQDALHKKYLTKNLDFIDVFVGKKATRFRTD